MTPDSYTACKNVVKMVNGKFVNDSMKYSIIVHNYGYVVDIGCPCGIIIEDCAEALGTCYQGKRVGTFGALSVFSFYGNKTLTTGEGGMVCTNNRAYALKVRHLKNQAMIEPYIHDQVGYNYRMTNLQAAIGCAQLERIDELIEKKVKVTSLYRSLLDLESLVPLDENYALKGAANVFWMNAFHVKNSYQFRLYMESQGIETRPGFNPSSDIVLLPSGTTLNEEDIKYVCDRANKFKAS